jgi:hypothetical protein
MATDWATLMSMDATKAVRPPPIPKGHYQALISGHKFVEADNEKKTPGVEFTFSHLTPQGDVDPESWNTYLKHPAVNGGPVDFTRTVWVTPKSMWRLADLCKKAGAIADGTMLKMIEDVKNMSIILVIEQKVAADGSTIFADVAEYLPAK